jgi:hypothetical protein
MMGILKNTTDGIYPFLWDKLNQGGFKHGEMMLIARARQTGKSYYQKMMLNQIYGTNLCREIMLPMNPEPKYKFSRSKWHIADFRWQDQHKVFLWCEEQFGQHPHRPDAWSRWKTMLANSIAFRDEKDYAWFVLRWK